MVGVVYDLLVLGLDVVVDWYFILWLVGNVFCFDGDVVGGDGVGCGE